jgi:hypothetical protein
MQGRFNEKRREGLFSGAVFHAAVEFSHEA